MFALSCRMVVASGLAGLANTGGLAADIYPFEGSSWRVAAINGDPTPPSVYSINFGENIVTGQLGCNDFGGKTKVSGANLDVSALRATSRICGDIAATREGDVFAVLSRPLRMEWKSRDLMTIASSAGNISLERLP